MTKNECRYLIVIGLALSALWAPEAAKSWLLLVAVLFLAKAYWVTYVRKER